MPHGKPRSRSPFGTRVKGLAKARASGGIGSTVSKIAKAQRRGKRKKR